MLVKYYNEHFKITDPTYFSNEINEQIQLQSGVAYFSLKQFSDALPYFQSIIQLGNSQYLKTAHYYLGFIAFSNKSSDLGTNPPVSITVNSTPFQSLLP